MATWDGKTRGGKTGYGIFIFILKHFNISVAYFVLRFVAFYFILFAPKAFKSLFYFYNKRLGFGFIKSMTSIYKNYFKFGQILLDKIALMAGKDNIFTYDFTDEVHLARIIEENTGGILISAHVGSWEISAKLLSRLNGKFNIVMMDAEHEKIKEQLSKVAQNKKSTIILVKDDLSHVYQINEALSNKEFICILGDRYIANNKTISHNYFNESAKFPYGVFYLAARYHVPVLFVYAIKTKIKHYKFFVTTPKYYDSGMDSTSIDETVKIILDEYIENLEGILNKYPDHWFNYFHFWDGTK